MKQCFSVSTSAYEKEHEVFIVRYPIADRCHQHANFYLCAIHLVRRFCE
jgi:hypothetical protein